MAGREKKRQRHKKISLADKRSEIALFENTIKTTNWLGFPN